ncbi:MAG: sensor histidine kinase [Saprospiraceae bacterium]
MQAGIRRIFIIMLICIVGTNGFQAYWLYQAYQKNISEFRREVQSTLMDAAQKISLQQFYPAVDSSLQIKKGNTIEIEENHGPMGNASNKIIMIKVDSSEKKGAKTVHSSIHISSYQSADYQNKVDSIARTVVSLAMFNRDSTKIDLKAISEMYRNMLLQKNINEPFTLDTLRIANPWGKRHAEDNTARITTRPVPLNIMSSLHVRASFDYPRSLIFYRMSGLLIASLLLLGLTTWCFIYMLQTIIRQKKLAEIKNDFINNMTHELRTPVATVSAAIEAMQKFDILDDRQKTHEYLAMSASQLGHLSDLIDEVLTTAVEDRKPFEIHKEKLNLNELIAQLIAQQQMKSRKPLEFKINGLESEVYIEADPIHFPNALNNLLDNAIKYSGPTPEISITYSYNKKHQIEISDKGKGIPAQYINQVFDNFFRVPDGDVHNVKGFGLGLSYVKKVIEQHGAQISVKSELGKGSSFVIINN